VRMPAGARPEAIDSRLVFHMYAALAVTAALVRWGADSLGPGDAYPTASTAAGLWQMGGPILAAAACCALAYAAIDVPHTRRRALGGFALAHAAFGTLLLLDWFPTGEPFPPLAWTPFVVGLVLVHLAYTGPSSDVPASHGLISLFDGTNGGLVRRRRLGDLRSAYEGQIRVAARREERARLARDLHDAVKQQLFAVQTAATTAELRFDTDPAGARDAIGHVRTAARDAMSEMRAMLEQLEAEILGNAGLVESIRAQVEALKARTGADVRIDIGTLPRDDELAPDAREAFFRIVQEAVANVARHARASRVSVSLGLTGQELILVVSDDGGGFDELTTARGMGLAGMKARADQAGGTLTVRSSPGRGTTVRLTMLCERPSRREYAWKTALWTAPLLFIAARVGESGTSFLLESPILIAVMAIATINVGRHAYAVYRLRGRQAAA
jgi:signal transduction histidine kinase